MKVRTNNFESDSEALANAGGVVVINGRDGAALDAAARDSREAPGAAATPIIADPNTAAGRAKIVAPCPDADILINNNAGPPPRDFRDLDHSAMVAGVEADMLAPVALIQALIDGMMTRRFGQIVNITSASVKGPMPALNLSTAARAGLTGFVAGIARESSRRPLRSTRFFPGPSTRSSDRYRRGRLDPHRQ